MNTASYLFSKEKYNQGNEKCFYCGLFCDETYVKKDYVKKTFTNRDIVKFPGSNYVCGCCVESLAGLAKTKQIDGTVKTGRGGSPRICSWILTENKKIAMTKKHMRVLRRIILKPPKPPFSIILADSGQKQLIFRAPVNHDRNVFSVLLEEKTIEVNKDILKIYLDKAVIVSAAIGKIALKNPDQFINYKNVIELYDSELSLVEWLEIYTSPLGELAAWLCPGKDESNGIIISKGIQTEISRSERSIKESTRDGAESNQGRSDQVLLDFT